MTGKHTQKATSQKMKRKEGEMGVRYGRKAQVG